LKSCYNEIKILHKRKGDVMAKVITYECKECGCEIVVSGTHESHLRPIYCCGTEVAKISPASKEAAAKRAEKKTVTKAVKKTAAKKPLRKRGPAQRKTSGR
jgi:hypothetical protein